MSLPDAETNSLAALRLAVVAAMVEVVEVLVCPLCEPNALSLATATASGKSEHTLNLPPNTTGHRVGTIYAAHRSLTVLQPRLNQLP